MREISGIRIPDSKLSVAAPLLMLVLKDRPAQPLILGSTSVSHG